MGIELTIWALLGIAVFLILGFFSAETDSAILATGTFLIGILLLEFAFGVGILSAMVTSPFVAVGVVFAHIIIGALYVVVWRWPEYIREHSDSINSAYESWAAKRNSNQSNSFDDFLESSSYKFNAWQNKERLGVWVGLWIFSLTWELSRKPAIWMWDTLYSSLGNTLQHVGKRAARRAYAKKG